MDDEDLYDEFGNYIGPELEEDEEEDQGDINDLYNQNLKQEGLGEQDQSDKQEEDIVENGNEIGQNQIVLHEDKKYYQSAQEIYGQDVEALVQEEDAQPLTKPIIAPVKENVKFEHEKNLPVTIFNKE
jgi:U5 small nuclear ribonucleoprotein component